MAAKPHKVRGAMRRMRGIYLPRYRRFLRHFRFTIGLLQKVLTAVTCLMSVVCLVAMVVYVGFEHSTSRAGMLLAVLRTAQGIFALNVIYGLVFEPMRMLRTSRVFKWIVDVAIIVSVLPWIYPRPEVPWIPWLSTVLYHKAFLFSVLGAYSVVELSYAMMHLVTRRTNPSLLMTGSFIFFIMMGSVVLMLPKCTYESISYVDALFVSTSAVCITGLTSVDIPTTFTPMGLLCVGLLAQIGGLGILTFTSFFALFFSGNTSIFNQLLIRDLVYSRTINALLPTLLYIVGFTLTIEALGAVAIYFTIPDALGMTFDQKAIFSAFHAMSSFCNAGFSCLPGGMSNPALMTGNGSIYIVTSVLVLAGAIGFPILVNFKDVIAARLRRLWAWITRRPCVAGKLHLYDFNTRLVLHTTLGILVVASVLFFILEYNNTLRGMSLYDKVVQSVFNSLTPRSAGFASVNPAEFLPVTLLLVMFQMWIGGASQSMAGGIKVNSFGAVLLNLRSIILGHKGTTAFGRTISQASIRRANAVIALSILALLLYCTVVLLLEPHLPTRAVVFETVSALFTVGSSLGITADLCDASKVVLSTAMLLGRVGIISLLSSFVGTSHDRTDYFPEESVIIN